MSNFCFSASKSRSRLICSYFDGRTFSLQGIRRILLIIFFFSAKVLAAQHIESWGTFFGMNFPFTIDQGLQKDPRYYGKLTLRATPVGFNYGYDRVGHGFLITPSYQKIGQKYMIQNTVGGEIGSREVQMDYFTVPVALKLHLNDMAFFRLSVVAAINFDYLLSGKEVISHAASKVQYPPSNTGVIPPNELGYTVVYDGVFVPEVNEQVYVSKDKFKAFQLSAAVGFRSDFDFNDDWSMNFDGRAIFGIFDPRKESYISQLNAGSSTNPVPDLYGQRREVNLAAVVGISRIIQIKQKFQAKTTTKPAGSSTKKKQKRPKR